MKSTTEHKSIRDEILFQGAIEKTMVIGYHSDALIYAICLVIRSWI